MPPLPSLPAPHGAGPGPPDVDDPGRGRPATRRCTRRCPSPRARVPSCARAAMTRPSWVPKTTRPCETAGGISMRLSPGIRWTTSERRPEARGDEARAGRRRAEHRPARVRNRLPARRLAPRPASGSCRRTGRPTASRSGTKLRTARPGPQAPSQSDDDPRRPGRPYRPPYLDSIAEPCANLACPTARQSFARSTGTHVPPLSPSRRAARATVPRRAARRSRAPRRAIVWSPGQLAVLEQRDGEPERDAVLAEPGGGCLEALDVAVHASAEALCLRFDERHAQPGRPLFDGSQQLVRPVRSPSPRAASTAHTKPCLTACDGCDARRLGARSDCLLETVPPRRAQPSAQRRGSRDPGGRSPRRGTRTSTAPRCAGSSWPRWTKISSTPLRTLRIRRSCRCLRGKLRKISHRLVPAAGHRQGVRRLREDVELRSAIPAAPRQSKTVTEDLQRLPVPVAPPDRRRRDCRTQS